MSDDEVLLERIARIRQLESERYEALLERDADRVLLDALVSRLGCGSYGGILGAVSRALTERRQLRARLVECRPWVGVCPLESVKIQEVCLVRDLADDTLAEIKP